MPFPFQKKKSEKKNQRAGLTDPNPPPSYDGARAGGTPTQSPTPNRSTAPNNHTTAPPVAGDASRGMYGDARHHSPAHTPTEPRQPQKLVFTAFLAHGSPAGKIEGFTNVKELYEKIGEAFSMPAEQILFCTLNTFKVDMEHLLGGQIGLNDSIYAHIKGQKYEIAVNKSEPALGLTITDNGAGYAFVKRIKEGSVMSKDAHIDVGDHIVMINDRQLIGCRHYEVAKALKDLPVNEEFTMKLIKPNKAFNEIAPRGTKSASQPTSSIKTGKETLRFHNKGPAKVQALPSQYEEAAIKKVDDALESYMGIRDLDLATSIMDSFQGKNDFLEFMTAFEEDFGAFGFPQEFLFEVWGFINDAKERRLQPTGPVANNNTVVAEFDTQF